LERQRAEAEILLHQEEMKTTSHGRRSAVWLMMSVALLQAGCQTGGPKGSDGKAAFLASSPPVSVDRSRVVAHVRYVGQPNPYSFRVEDQSIGTDVHVLIGWLRGRGVTDVIFDSDYKLTPEGVRNLVKPINQSGMVVREFWIPRSTSPGRLDVLRGN
jgi:hypothetical protein